MAFAIRYQCQRCTACCRWPGLVRISDREIEGMAGVLGKGVWDFVQEYTELRPGRDGLALKNKPNGECIFLEGRDCVVQGAKPIQCQQFPNGWNFPGWREVCEAVPHLEVVLPGGAKATLPDPAGGGNEDAAGRCEEAAGMGGMKRGGGEQGFTLIELVFAVAIGVAMLMLALPSMTGLFAERRLRNRMEEFQEMARRASALAKESRQEVRLVWVQDRKGAQGVIMGTAVGAEVPGGTSFALEKGEKLELRRVAARKGVKAPVEWSFWPSGLREPVELSYAGPLGRWELRYGALSAAPDVLWLAPQ